MFSIIIICLIYILRWDSISKIKSGIAQITKELDEEEFKKIYKFAFNFAKEDNTQKNLTLEIAISMLQLVLKGHAHVESFSQFLNEQSEYKAMNIDQWMSFYEFSHTVSEDFSNYDENAACMFPILLKFHKYILNIFLFRACIT